MNDDLILVTGSTGTLGRAVVAALRRRGAQVVGASRRPAAPDAEGPAARRFDFEDPTTYEPALAGVGRVFLIARPGDDHADRVALPFIDAMRRVGVRHVVNVTAMGVERRPEFALHTVERHLEASGIAFTHLRPNFFMQIFAVGPLLAAVRAGQGLRVPAADARLSFIDARDIAEVAAVAFTEPGHRGQAYTLTGAAALDHAAVAAAISGASGRPVEYCPLEDVRAQEELAAAGFPEARVDRLLAFYRLVRAGFCASVSPDVERLLGRPPTSFERFAADHASLWR